MSESQPEAPGKHAASDDDPHSDPPPAAGEGGEHAADGPPEEGDEEPQTDQDSYEAGGTKQPGADPEDEEQIEEEREQRLDPDNRPDNAEVDNTDREFDPEKGMFTDAEGYDEAEAKFPAIGEQGA
jgi:hypothetical protein